MTTLPDIACQYRGDPSGQTAECGCGIGPQPVYHCLQAEVAQDLCLMRIGCGQQGYNARKQYADCSRCQWSDHRYAAPKPQDKRAEQRQQADQGRQRAPLAPRPGDEHRARQLREINSPPYRQLQPGDTVHVNCNPHGYGDAMIMAWIAEGAQDVTCLLCASGAKKSLLEAFGQQVAGCPADSINCFAAYSLELRDKGATGRVWLRARAMGIPSQPKRPKPLIPAADLRWAERYDRSTVILCPNTDYGSREWPPLYWIELYEQLLAAGLRPVLFTKDQRYAHLAHRFPTWPATMAAMLRARCVVCNESGPMHVAGTLDVKTIALLGPTTPSVHEHMPSVIPLRASSSEIACVGCYFHPPFRRQCESGCVALSHVLPQRVLAEVLT